MSQKNNLPAIAEINQFIYLGSYEHPFTNSTEFEKLKIDVVFNLSTEIEYTDKVPFRVEKFPLTKDDSISFVENMDQIVEKINHHLSKKKKIYLHSFESLSRAPAILIYFYMRYKSLSYRKVHHLLKKLYPNIAIHPELENALQIIDDADE